MKRLVWLVLLAFGTALTQVRPVLPFQAPAEACCCGEDDPAGACAQAAMPGMDDCVPCTTCIPGLNSVLPATAVAVEADPAEISRLPWLAERGRTLAYPPLLTPPRLAG